MGISVLYMLIMQETPMCYKVQIEHIKLEN